MQGRAETPRSGTESQWETGACADLGAFDRSAADRGAAAFVERTQGAVDWVCLMEDRCPDFFLGYAGYEPQAAVPLARHGPRLDGGWTHADLKVLVDALRARDVRVFLGFWIHECAFVDDDHPELLLRDERGDVWQDRVEQSADFNPLKRMRADPARGIAEGERFADYVVRQWKRLHADFGFDGLFLGDGGMGFRRFAQDADGVRAFDFDEAWVREFAQSAHMRPHAGCEIHAPWDGADPARRAQHVARDVHAHHYQPWANFAIERWTDFYAKLAEAVHATQGELAAYNVMNFDPTMAYQHGVDYRALAGAGLDVLVFQTYDYAWGPRGPFKPPHKDLETNLAALLATKAYVAGTRLRVVFTTETGDSVERWDAPTAHTLGEVYAYGSARLAERGAWRTAVDGTFVVWANETEPSEWSLLRRAFADVARETSPPTRVLVWDDRDVDLLAREGPDAGGYDHLARGADGVMRLTDAAPLPEAAPRAPAVRRRGA